MGVDPPALRVEEVLRLLPRLESLRPLLADVAAASKPDANRTWTRSAAYLTLGKREVRPADLRSRMGPLLERLRGHLEELFDTAISALERYGLGDGVGAANALLAAGACEERIGRLAEARAWQQAALDHAEQLTERSPELAALLALGATELRCGRLVSSAGRYRRCLALSEALDDGGCTIRACLGLGEIARTRDHGAEARAWLTRALRQAEALGPKVTVGHLERQLALVELRAGDFPEAARRLGRARALLEADGGGAGDLAHLLLAQGELHERTGDRGAAADYREALVRALGADDDAELELCVRQRIAEFHLRRGRPFEAQEELRRAERRALTGALFAWLARIYILLGRVRTSERDENGFVFFEQAIDLCRRLECGPDLDAQAHRAYGEFHEALGNPDAAHACFGRAEEILRPLGAEGSAAERI